MREKLKLLLCLIILMITNMAAFAQASKEEVVISEPGTLQEIIDNLESSRFESLTIKGNLNAKDIAFLRSGNGKMTKVETLDLSDVELIAGDEPYAQIRLGSAPGGAYGFRYGIFYISDEYKEITDSKSSGLGGSNVYHHIYCKDLSGAFFNNNSFEKVILPKSMENIGDYIFSEGSIKEITLSPKAKKIGKWAFRRCHNLEIVELPQGLMTIGEEAFTETLIKDMELPSSVKEIKSQAFEYSKLESINLDEVETLGERAFCGARELCGLLNLSKIEEIPTSCFSATKISSLILSPNLISIGKDGFSSCINIEKVEFGERLEYIGDYAFSDCSKLSEVELPSSVKQIGYGAFNGTPWGQKLVSENGIIYIGNIAYSYDGKYKHEGSVLTLRDGTIAISDGFSFPESVKEKVTSLNLPESLLEIGNEAFRGFKELGEVKLPSSLQRIGNGAFRDCPKFWCNLPDDLVTLGAMAFESCVTLSKVTLPESLRNIGGGVFNGTSVGTVYLNSINLDLAAYRYEYTSAYSPFEKCETLQKVVVGSNVTKLCDKLFPGKSSLKSVEFEDIENSKLNYLGDFCFDGCENLTFENIPQSISHIGENAFGGCGFKNDINIDNVKYIGERAFGYCKGFTSIRIPERVDTLGGVIFSGCKDLRHVEFNAKEFVGLIYSVGYAGGGGFSAEAAKIFEYCDSIESVSIGSKVKFLPYAIFENCRNIGEVKFESRENETDKTLTIGDYAFDWCLGITEIELPEGLVSIGRQAFYCTNINSIVIPSTCKFIGTDALSSRNGIDKVYFYSSEPPTIDVSLGGYYYDGGTTIYVPKDSYDLYLKVPELQGYEIRKMENGGIPVESITLNPESWEGPEGSSFSIEASVSPSIATNKSLSWSSSDESIAKVDDKGNVTTLKAGKVTITASSLDGSDIIARCEVIVKRIFAESIQLNLDAWSGVVGASVKLDAAIYPEDASYKILKWKSSDEAVATVDSEGTMTAVGVGEAEITVMTTDGSDISASCKVTVLPVLVESIKLEPESWHGVVGESVQIEAYVVPDNATDKTIKWTSSDESIVKVSEDGFIETVKAGEADIKATTSDGSEVTAVCHVIVNSVPVESIQINTTEWESVVGESIYIDATVYPENATDKKLIWTSSDESVATVNGNGYVEALKEGEAYISVKSAENSNISAVCHIKVSAVEIKTIRLNPESWSGTVGESIKIETTIYPENATYKTVIWTSSDESVAKVDAEGNVTALKEGKADIKAKASDGSDVSAVCHVTVFKPVLVESIRLNPESWSGKVGEKFLIQATVYPENAKEQTLIWTSSDESVVKVDAEGNVTALKEGKADITAKASDGSDVSAVCHVTVLPVLVESLRLNPESWSGKVGERFQIQAIVYPENAKEKTFVWTSSDESVAKVDAEGNVIALNVGTANITAKSSDGSNVSAVCHVSVLPVLVERIQLNPDTWSGEVGESFRIQATVFPEDVSLKTLVWTSSDESVAKVDAEGNVISLNVGTADITVKSSDGSNVSAVCHVSVLPILVEFIQLNPDTWSGEVGDTFQIQASVYPENATDKTLEWLSSDDSIAKVDSNGLVSVYEEGTCIITVRSTDGSDVTADCYITSVTGVEELLIDENDRIDIYNMNGILIRKNCSKKYLKYLTPDIYLIRIGNQVKRIVIR